MLPKGFTSRTTMFSLKSVVLALSLAFVVHSDYYIDPDSVNLAKRQQWCKDELSTCPIICQQTPPGSTLINTCDPKTLQYGCLCGNNKQPNVSEYTLTMPYFVCQEWGVQCVAGCGSDNTCASSCVQDHPCGAQHPTKSNSSTMGTMSSTASSTATNQLYTSLAGNDSQNNAPAIQAAGVMFGLLVVMASLFTGFAMML